MRVSAAVIRADLSRKSIIATSGGSWHLDAAVVVEDRATARQLHRPSRLPAETREIPADHVLGLGVRPVRDDLLVPLTTLPPASSGSPALKLPLLVSCWTQAAHFCMFSCICSGLKVVQFAPPRKT
jgi:hypothetical protein